MMKQTALLTLFLMLAGFTAQAGDEMTYTDFYTNSKITYVTKYKELKNNPFNLFEEISVNYPVISGYPKANNRLYYYCVPYLESDSFKLELLQRSKIASGIFLDNHVNDYSRYMQNNHTNLLPTITDVDFRLQFLFDGVLAINFAYTYSLGTGGEQLDETFVMEKQLFVRLSDGQVSKPADIISLNKRSAFKSDIEKRIADFAKEHPPATGNTGYGENGEEGDDDGSYPYNTGQPPRSGNPPVELNDLVLTISPYGVIVHIPAYSVNSTGCYGLPADFDIATAEFKSYLDAVSPLKNYLKYSKTFSTPLHGVNLFRQTRYTGWTAAFNPQHDNDIFAKAPAGVKSVSQYIRYKNQSDTAAKLQRIRLYDKAGRLTEEQYYNNDKGPMSGNITFEYNTDGLLVKITNNMDRNDKTGYQWFTYDAAANLTEWKEKDNEGITVTHRYKYENLTATEIMESSEPDDDAEKIRVYSLTPGGKIISSWNFGEEQQWKNHYDGERLLGSGSIKRPTLDNTIYCYNTAGKLLTVQSDNGRHLYEFNYNSKGELGNVTYMDSRQLKGRWIYEYNSKGQRTACTMSSDMYGYNSSGNFYRYLFEYAYYE